MRKILSIALLAIFTLGVAQAQTADAIAKKYVEAIGGAAKWKALKSLKQTINLNTQGIDITGTIVADSKNRVRAEMEAMGSKIIQAHDGTTAWWINPFMGSTVAVKMPEAQAKEFLAEEFLDSMIDWKKRGGTLTLEGEETVEDVGCYKLKLVKKDQSETLYFVSMENNLLVMAQSQTNAQGYPQTINSYPSDYMEENGILIPRKIVVKSGGVVQRTTTINSIEMNVAVTDDMFAYPGN